jgi:hypothetical protein
MTPVKDTLGVERGLKDHANEYNNFIEVKDLKFKTEEAIA